MQQTEHLGLNQWELSDRILMKDFNADNQKIDEALRTHQSAELIVKKLIETEDPYKYQIDISGIQWERYMMVAVLVHTQKTNGFLLDMRGFYERATYIDTYTGADAVPLIDTTSHICHLEYVNHMTMLIPVFYSGDHMLTAISFGSGDNSTGDRGIHSGLCCGGAIKLLKDFTQIEVSCPHILKLTTGDQIELWGVR